LYDAAVHNQSPAAGRAARLSIGRPAASGAKTSGIRVAIVLLIAATLLLLPSLIRGTLFSHSSPQNLTWAKQFADQFRAGTLYPRWLPQSFDGLGSPTFYFYPPLGFWLDTLVSIVTFNVLSVSYRLSLSALVVLLASGLSMHAWLKEEANSSRTALYGALAYMAAPYHLIDHYYRGAYAEFAAYAFLPLVMLAIRWTAQGRQSGPVLLAVFYAALPMAHLPTSLLISLTAIPAYVLFRGWKIGVTRPAVLFFLRCTAGGLLGLGLAGIYLIPALALQDWIPAETFWTGGYRIENWFLLMPGRWPAPATDMMGVIAWSAVAYGIAACGVLAVLALHGRRQSWRSETAFWAFLSIVCLLIIGGALPWFWQIPFTAKVQFPWRLMIVVEFAAITALCSAPWHLHSRMTFVLIAVIAALVPTFAGLGGGVRLRVQVSSAHQESPADVKQFEPAGYPQNPRGDYADLSLEPLGHTPTIACSPPVRACRTSDLPFGELTIDVDGDMATTVVVRRFYFPYWQLSPPLPIVATDPLRLVSFVSPPGHRVYRLRHVAVPQEQAGWVISGLSVLLLLAWTGFALRRPRRAADGIRPDTSSASASP